MNRTSNYVLFAVLTPGGSSVGVPGSGVWMGQALSLNARKPLPDLCLTGGRSFAWDHSSLFQELFSVSY